MALDTPLRDDESDDERPSLPQSPPPGVPLPAEPVLSPADEAEALESKGLAPNHPAYDRVQERSAVESATADTAGRTGRWLAGTVLLLAALAVTYLLLRPSDSPEGVPDLLALAASYTDRVTPSTYTEDLDEAQTFIIGEFGWPVRVPVISGARLASAGVAEVADGVELPVLQYVGEDETGITVYIYDYAFLDAAEGRVALTPAVYSRLAEDDGVDVRRVGDRYTVLWRRRAAIYLAVTNEEPTALVESLRRKQ